MIKIAIYIVLALFLQSARNERAEDSKRPKDFATAMIQVINSKSTESLVALLHDRSRTCINTNTQPYFDWIFSRRFKYNIPLNYKVKVTKFHSDTSRTWKSQSTYPVNPSHQLEIDYETESHHSNSIVVYIVFDGLRWREVLPCPRSDEVESAQRSTTERKKQEERARMLVTQLSEPLKSEIIQLAKDGRRVDAVLKYVAQSGEDLTIATLVIDLLVPKD